MATARTVRLATLVVLAMGAAVLVPVEPAAAFTCIRVDPRAQLAGADAAFIGALVSWRSVAGQEYGQEQFLTFRVDEAVKGNLGEMVEVRDLTAMSYSTGSTDSGREEGVFIYASERGFVTSGCSRASPEQLRLARRGGPTVKKATDTKAKMSFRLKGRRLTVSVARNASRRVKLALERPIKLVCGNDVFGTPEAGGPDYPLGTARSRFRHGARKMTVVLDRDVSRAATSCGVEQGADRFIASVQFFSRS